VADKLKLPELSEHDEMFLRELSGRIGELASAHIASEKEYFPYDFVDEIDQAVADKKLDLEAEDTRIDEPTRQALIVNLLTEEGLPEYTSTIQRRLPRDHPLLEWTHLWTADEGRHAPTISGVLHSTHQLNMRDLERMRMVMMRNPDTPQPDSIVESFIYPGIQEPATKVSHRNTMVRIPKSLVVVRRALGFVIGDEVRHEAFYAGASEAAMELDPSITTIAVARQVKAFRMPGKSIPGFGERSIIIEDAGIFGLKQLRQIYEEFIVERLGVYRAEKLSPTAEEARDFIAKRLQLMDKIIKRRTENITEATVS